MLIFTMGKRLKANVIGWSFQAVVGLFFSSVFTFVGLYNGLRFGVFIIAYGPFCYHKTQS